MNQNYIVTHDMQEITSQLGKALSSFEGENVLITGASGMIAGYLVETLLYANKNIFKRPAVLFLLVRTKKKPYGTDKNVHYIYGDIAKKKFRIKNIHYIIHAASKAAPKKYLVNKIDTLNTNILGLYNLLDIDRTHLKSFLYISSAEIYGDPSTLKKVEEKYVGCVDHLNERSCYVEAKRSAETICMNYYWEQNLPVKIVRLFHTFGPGLSIHDGRVYSDFIKNGLDKKNIVIRGNKSIKRSLLYLSDATAMILYILLSEKNGEVYNVGNDKNVVTIGLFAQKVAECINKRINIPVQVLEQKDKTSTIYKNAVSTIMPNINKFKNEFGYVPHTTIKEAIQRTVDYSLFSK